MDAYYRTRDYGKAIGHAREVEPSYLTDVGYEVIDALSALFELPEWFPKSLVDGIAQAQAAREG
jgi:hypothetical protein